MRANKPTLLAIHKVLATTILNFSFSFNGTPANILEITTLSYVKPVLRRIFNMKYMDVRL
jgi:hypothetical protein